MVVDHLLVFRRRGGVAEERREGQQRRGDETVYAICVHRGTSMCFSVLQGVFSVGTATLAHADLRLHIRSGQCSSSRWHAPPCGKRQIPERNSRPCRPLTVIFGMICWPVLHYNLLPWSGRGAPASIRRPRYCQQGGCPRLAPLNRRQQRRKKPLRRCYGTND